MRTAFAVMGGFIAADLITTSMHMAAIEKALANVSTEMEQALTDFDVTGSMNFDDADDFNTSEFGGLDSGDIDADGAGEGLGELFQSLFS